MKTKNGLKSLLAALFLLGATISQAQCNASFSYVVGPNGVVSFSSTSTGTVFNTSYSWNFNGTTMVAGTNPSWGFVTNGMKSVCLTINDTINNCTSTYCDSISVTTVTTAPTPTCQAAFTHTLGANGLVHFFNISTGAGSGTSYSWNFGASGTYVTNTYTANGTYVACLSINNSTCSSTWCDSITVSNVTTAPTGTPCQAGFNYTLGANGLVNFSSNSTGTTGFTNYSWSFGAFGANASNTYTSNGVKLICLTISDTVANCSDIYCDSLIITNATGTTICNPSVVYTLSKDSTMSLTWNAYPYYPAGITGATWYWGDGSSTTGLYPSHTYSAAGTYSTCVTVSVSCGTVTATYCYVASIWKGTENNDMIQINVKSSSPTGIKNNTKSNDWISIFPNPSNGEFTLDLNTGNNQKQSTISIYNIMGEKVFEKQVTANSKQIIDVSTLSEGTYFVKVNSGDSYLNKKITIQK